MTLQLAANMQTHSRRISRCFKTHGNSRRCFSSVPRTSSMSPLICTESALHTVPSACYYSESHFEKEKNNIFRKSWCMIGHKNALCPKTGTYAEVTAAGESILVIRNGDDTFSAFYNVCSHRAHELVKPRSRGKLNSKVLTCPNHAWSFKASSGELVKARFSEDVADFCKVDYNLKTIAIKEMSGLLFVNLDDSPSLMDLGSVFGADLSATIVSKIPGIDSPDMQQVALKQTVMNANWKILVDNFLECYHCDVAHKDFVDMVDLNQYSTEINPHHVAFESVCKPDNKAYKFNPDDPIQNVFFCWLWPNSVVYSAPGSLNLSILQFIPLTPTTTLRVGQRFAIADPTTASTTTTTSDAANTTQEQQQANGEETEAEAVSRKSREEYLNQVLLEEDTSICESVQRGVKSGAYKQGRLIVSKGGLDKQAWHTEVAVAQFHHLLRKYTLSN